MLLPDFFRKVMNISEEELLQTLEQISEIRILKHGEFLFQVGETPLYLCFLISGVIRGFVSDVNGKDTTDCIVFNCGDSVMPDNDFTQPATVFMQAIEDSEVVCVSIEGVLPLLQQYPELTVIWKNYVLKAGVMHRNLKIALCQFNAQQRYEWFLQTYPGLIDRVSHKFIASLLNMTPVTLSKVRRNLKNDKDT